MRYTFDLSESSFSKFEFFPHSVAAFAIPNSLNGIEQLSLLVWGVVFPEPEQDAEFCRTLQQTVPITSSTVLYLSGWASLTFRSVQGGEVAFWPYQPTFHYRDLRLVGPSDAEPAFIQQWPGEPQENSGVYCLPTILEQPFGFMTLKVKASGPVTLSLNSQDFVPADQVDRSPHQYGFDFTRTRQLMDLSRP
jgi:hypothetical protein